MYYFNVGWYSYEKSKHMQIVKFVKALGFFGCLKYFVKTYQKLHRKWYTCTFPKTMEEQYQEPDLTTVSKMIVNTEPFS